jgi:hypothetical protein
MNDASNSPLFDVSSACKAKGHAASAFSDAIVWIMANRSATRAFGGVQEYHYDFIDAFRSELSAYFSLMGIDLIVEHKAQAAILANRPRSDERASGARLPGYAMPDLEHDILLAGLYCLCAERQTAITAGRFDSASGFPVVESNDVHRAMDATFRRKIQSQKPKQHLLWRALCELGFARAVPNSDGRYVVGPAIDLLISSETLSQALAQALARARTAQSTPPEAAAEQAGALPLL